MFTGVAQLREVVDHMEGCPRDQCDYANLGKEEGVDEACVEVLLK